MNASRGCLSPCEMSFYVTHLCQVIMLGWCAVHTYCTEPLQSSQPALQWGLPVDLASRRLQGRDVPWLGTPAGGTAGVPGPRTISDGSLRI